MMVDRRAEEARVCPVHGDPLEVRREGLYCKHCERMGQHGQVIVAACPYPACGLGLLNVTHCIKGLPSVKIGWRYTEPELRDGQDHLLYVSAFWGDHASESDVAIADGKVLDLFCPFCGREFPKAAHCLRCNAKMVEIRALYVHGGAHGAIRVCARRGCTEHRKVRPDEQTAVASLQLMRGDARRAEEAILAELGQGSRG